MPGTATAERREEMLGELAEWLHAAAHKVQRKLMETDETDEVVRLAGSLTKLARGVRQCVLMHDRLEGQRRKAEADEAHDAASARAELVHRFTSRISRTLVRRATQEWLEHEDLDEDEFEERSDSLNLRLTERLDDLAEAEDLLARDPDALIVSLCKEFGIAPPATSPIAAAMAGGGPLAAERVVEGASSTHRASGHTPNTS